MKSKKFVLNPLWAEGSVFNRLTRNPIVMIGSLLLIVILCF